MQLNLQEDVLPQTDRASAIRDLTWKIFFHTSSLITMQNLVVVSLTVCVDVGSPRNLKGDDGPRSLENFKLGTGTECNDPHYQHAR